MKSRELVIVKKPKSFFAESIRNIRTHLLLSSRNQNVKLVLNTSPEVGEGTSFVTANLAVAFAQDDKNVLLIDGNLRRGRQHDIFHVTNTTSGGYSNLISNYHEDFDFEKYICETEFKHLDLLPTGPLPQNPVELLGSDNNRKLLERLKKEYDVILIDCSPVLGLSDALVLASITDVNLITVSEKQTKMENLEKVKKEFDQLHLKINGVILNRASVSGNDYYGYYSTNDYYGDEVKKK